MHTGHSYLAGLISAIVIGLVFGAIEATLWIIHYFTGIRYVIPYATADALIIFALTPLLALLFNKATGVRNEENCHPHEHHISPYVKTIMISAAVYLIFVQIAVTLIPYSLKIILAFVGSISFWIMFIVFIAMIFYMVRKK